VSYPRWFGPRHPPPIVIPSSARDPLFSSRLDPHINPVIPSAARNLSCLLSGSPTSSPFRPAAARYIVPSVPFVGAGLQPGPSLSWSPSTCHPKPACRGRHSEGPPFRALCAFCRGRASARPFALLAPSTCHPGPACRGRRSEGSAFPPPTRNPRRHSERSRPTLLPFSLL